MTNEISGLPAIECSEDPETGPEGRQPRFGLNCSPGLKVRGGAKLPRNIHCTLSQPRGSRHRTVAKPCQSSSRWVIGVSFEQKSRFPNY